MSPECWAYIIHLLQGEICSVQKICRSICHAVGAGLDLYSVWIEKMGTKVSFSAEKEIGAMVGLFGESCFCGIRKKRPKLSDGTKILQENDSINFISGENTEVSLCYDGDGTISIAVSYRVLLYKDEEVSGISPKRLKTLIQRKKPKLWSK